MFSQTGVYLRKPGGNVENIPHQKPVVRWAALNVGEEVERDPSRWDHQRKLYADAGIETFPWLHCRKPEDLDFLISVGKLWQSPAIGLNIEDVQTDFRLKGLTLAEHVAPKLADWPREIHMPTLPWVQNGQGWSSLDSASSPRLRSSQTSRRVSSRTRRPTARSSRTAWTTRSRRGSRKSLSCSRP